MLIISHKSRKDFTQFLDDNNISYLKTIDNKNLDKRIADHPDLSIFKLDENNIIVDESVYDYYKKNLNHINIIRGESVKKTYPHDSIYNIVRFKSFFIHNNFTEKHIKKYFEDKNIDHLFVKQGYTRCSTLPLKSMILTSDYGIYKSLRDKIDIKLLYKEEIELDGFDEGFLGGCFGLIGDDRLIFNGNIESLSSYDIIKNMSDKENMKLLYPDCKLKDTGSIIWI